MKTLTLKKLSSIFLALFMLVTIGCEYNDSVAPEFSEQEIEQPNMSGLNVLSFGVKERSLQKITTTSKWMTIENGGFLQLFHLGDDTTDLMFVYSQIVIQPNTMSADAEIGLTVDDQNFAGEVDIEFAPHGIQFSQPALLSMVAYGLDLSGVEENALGFYYLNEETGIWETMEYENLYVNKAQGILYIYNGKLPHFSRYAIGTE